MSALRRILLQALGWAGVFCLLFCFPTNSSQSGVAERGPGEDVRHHEEPPSLTHDHEGEHSHDTPAAWASAGGSGNGNGNGAVLGRSRESLARRLLGPIATLVASAQWVRYDLALRADRMETAYARAALALQLDPGAGQGWITLAEHLIYQRGAADLEQDLEARLAWIRTGLELLEVAKERARNRHEVAFAVGLMHMHLAHHAENIGWPPGKRGALEAAVEAFDLAGEWGHSAGDSQATDCRRWLRNEAGRPVQVR